MSLAGVKKVDWSARALSPNWRSEFPNNHGFPADYNSGSRKDLTLMTDGEVTRNIPLGDGVTVTGAARRASDALAKESFNSVCNAMKAENKITMYMIGFTLKAADQNARTYLRNCVSGVGKYYDANTDDLEEIMQEIADDINQIRLTN